MDGAPGSLDDPPWLDRLHAAYNDAVNECLQQQTYSPPCVLPITVAQACRSRCQRC